MSTEPTIPRQPTRPTLFMSTPQTICKFAPLQSEILRKNYAKWRGVIHAKKIFIFY
jgi:hypothetical protein